MMLGLIITLFSLIALVVSSPIKRADPSETDILQFALTLEHLESAFYNQFLAQFSLDDFTNAGFNPFVRGRMSQVCEHEAQHVKFLEAAIGNGATQACTYKFPVTDVQSFVSLAVVLEAVGVTAYLGAAQFLHTPSTLTAAGSILTTEARHNAFINSVGEKSFPWSGPNDTPQTLNQVFSLASPFIESCPSSNPTLPVKAFPPLTATQSSDLSSVSLKFDGSQASGQFLAVMSGLATEFVPIENGQATLPKGLQGHAFAVVSSDGKTVSDASTIAGPAVLTFPFSSTDSDPGPNPL